MNHIQTLKLEENRSDSKVLKALKKHFIKGKGRELTLTIWNPYHRLQLYWFADFYDIAYDTNIEHKMGIKATCNPPQYYNTYLSLSSPTMLIPNDKWIIDRNFENEANAYKSITFAAVNHKANIQGVFWSLIHIMPSEIIRYLILPYTWSWYLLQRK